VTRIVWACAAGAIVLAGLAGLAVMPRIAGRAGGTQPGSTVTIGGPFALIDGHGKAVTDTDFRGRFMLVYFGYTHCPDACPTMLSDMAAALDQLPGADRAAAVPIFITVDPERDTAAMMGDYVQAFGPHFVGLTGSAADIAKAEAAYHVYAVKHPLKNGDYAMDHSSILYVMGRNGHFLGVVEDAKPAVMAQQLQNLGV
jgi:protein SCO1/2